MAGATELTITPGKKKKVLWTCATPEPQTARQVYVGDRRDGSVIRLTWSR
jgi:hypothetical protein